MLDKQRHNSSFSSALAPFINQLRDLRHSYDEMQKKVQKHWSILKIKGSDQAEFLRQLSTSAHGNDKRHLLMEKLRQNELLIELREKEVQRLAAILFRAESCSPGIESNPSQPSSATPGPRSSIVPLSTGR